MLPAIGPDGRTRRGARDADQPHALPRDLDEVRQSRARAASGVEDCGSTRKVESPQDGPTRSLERRLSPHRLEDLADSSHRLGRQLVEGTEEV